MKPLRLPAWVWVGIGLAGALPILLYWMVSARLPAAPVHPGQALHGATGSQAATVHPTTPPAEPPAGQPVPGTESGRPFRPMSLAKQWLAVIIAFGVKPVYMLVSLGLIVLLWRARDRDLAALRWGFIWFWLGENACSINYLFFNRASDFWEYLHNYGMVVGFSFVAYAVLEGVDYRVVKFSPAQDRCVLLGLCRSCAKHSEAPCALQRLFKLGLPALAVLGFMPLCSGLSLKPYNTEILGSVITYSHPLSCQLYEMRFCTPLAVLLLAASWLLVARKGHAGVPAAKILLAAAVGPLGFGLIRYLLFTSYADDYLWFDFWEEITEWLFIVSVAFVLWIFRHALFPKVKAPLEG